MQPQRPIPAPQMIDMQALDAANPDDRRQMVGNAVYPVINGVFGDQYAAKITGMVIDESAVDVKRLFIDNDYFSQHVNEAHTLISQQMQQQ